LDHKRIIRGGSFSLTQPQMVRENDSLTSLASIRDDGCTQRRSRSIFRWPRRVVVMGPWSVPLGFVRRGCRLPCGRHGESPHPRRGESWLMSFAPGPLVRTRLTQREGFSRANHGQGGDSQATDMPSILCSLKAPYGGKAMCQSASGAQRDQLNLQSLPRELDQSRI